MLVMMETVRNKVKDNAKEGRWTHLYVDEFHELLGVPQVAEFILKLWKEIRKMSGILNGITQNMTDLLNNDNGGKLSAILSNTEYFALLSQSTLDKEKLMKFLPQRSYAMTDRLPLIDQGHFHNRVSLMIESTYSVLRGLSPHSKLTIRFLPGMMPCLANCSILT